ncbi:DUF3576 domain-containing protein [Palleronia sp. LCG004]|uniref:DUF3576 domain-containing protein n=1 Tax=Palleronia sp. LCG004 TaxID=3079304 RepID=UPI002943BB84|nr:DUF3576 domain-containing protein [Palleronia sp. LCG004]WOI55538.1 DUF3576 domain-containing protein [Palleronia sp. LCG004]
MRITTTIRAGGLLTALAILAACGENESRALPEPTERSTIWDLFRSEDPNVTIAVNKYIWTAAQQVLDFMPVETADPFSGVIVYGYGRPPGGGPAYRATVYVQDPALDARSLNVALATQSGPASADTIRAIEDAILTRARQLRLSDARL